MLDFFKRYLKEMMCATLSLAPLLVLAEHHEGGRGGGNPSWNAASRQRYSYDKGSGRREYKSDDRQFYRRGDYDRRYYGHSHQRYYNNYYYASPSPYYSGYVYPSYYYSYPYYAYPYEGYYNPYYDPSPNVGLYFQLGN